MIPDIFGRDDSGLDAVEQAIWANAYALAILNPNVRKPAQFAEKVLKTSIQRCKEGPLDDTK